MKFNDILMAIDNNTMIRVTMEMYGMKFSTNHYCGPISCFFYCGTEKTKI